MKVIIGGGLAGGASITYARRLEAAKEPPVELSQVPELRQRYSDLAGSTRK